MQHVIVKARFCCGPGVIELANLRGQANYRDLIGSVSCIYTI